MSEAQLVRIGCSAAILSTEGKLKVIIVSIPTRTLTGRDAAEPRGELPQGVE